eukprot:scaffold107829_cov29-Prasinocladus_malaysianus.AAC.2
MEVYGPLVSTSFKPVALLATLANSGQSSAKETLQQDQQHIDMPCLKLDSMDTTEKCLFCAVQHEPHKKEK